MSAKKFFITNKYFFIFLSILALSAYSYVVFAAPSLGSGGYAPGAELDPDCQPGDTGYDCKVQGGWLLGGNSGTTAGTQFIGTTDVEDFVLKTNNAEAMRINSGGNVGIGITTPETKLDLLGDFKNVFTHGDGTLTLMGNNDNFLDGGEQLAGMISLDPTDGYFYGSVNGDMNIGSGSAVQNLLLDFTTQKSVTITNEWNGGNPRVNLSSSDGINFTGSVLTLPTSGEVNLASTTTGGIDTGITLDGTGFHYNYDGTNFTLPTVDGTTGQILKTDGSGNFSWVNDSTGTATTPGGLNTQIQFNNSGSFGGSSDFTWNNSTKSFFVGGTVGLNTMSLTIEPGNFSMNNSGDTNFTSVGNINMNAASTIYTTNADNTFNVGNNIFFNVDNDMSFNAVDTTFQLTGDFVLSGGSGFSDYINFRPNNNDGFEFTTMSEGFVLNDYSPYTNIVTYMGSSLTSAGPGNVARGLGSFTAHLDQQWDAGYYNLLDAGGVPHAQIYYGVLDSGNSITDTSRVEASPTEVHLFHLNIGTAASYMLSVNDNGLDYSGGSTGFTIRNPGVGIGTTAATDKLEVFGDIRVGTSGNNGCIKDFSGTGFGGTCSSDERLKTNIVPVTNVLEKLTSINLVNYEWNSLAATKGFMPGIVQLGVIAQNVEQVFPDLVVTDKDGYKQVNYTRLGMMNLEAIKELNIKIKSVEDFANAENKTFLDSLVAWLGNKANGITDIFAGTLHAKDQICIDDVCVTKADLQQMIQNKNTVIVPQVPAQPAPGPEQVSDPVVEPVSEEVATEPVVEVVPETTPEVVNEPVVDPAPEADPVPESPSSETP